MPTDDDEDLSLRDKLAAAALPALIDRFTDRAGTTWVEGGNTTTDFDKNVKLIAIMAYKIADAMRKARLQAFT
jgi:hypothetical protein